MAVTLRRSAMCLVSGLALSLSSLPATAQPSQASPAQGAMQLREVAAPAETGAIPLRRPVRNAPPENWTQMGNQGRWVRNVVNPTLTPFLPEPGKATGAAVIVAPGGAFRFVSIDSEGYAVARWLADRGVAAFVLKYRTVPTPRGHAQFLGALMQVLSSVPTDSRPLDATPEAVEDGQAAIRLVRARAAAWRIDPARVGFLGFSAGAITALSVGLAPRKADRPDFIGPIYGPMWARAVPRDAPPMFAAIALDDPLFAKGKSMGLVQSWRDAGAPVEAHLYERGGHGFGMNRVSSASELWIDEFHAWMRDRKLLAAAAK